MTDGIWVKGVRTVDERTDAQSDRKLLSGTVEITVIYGATEIAIPVSFAGKHSHDAAVIEALSHVEHLFHWGEGEALRVRLAYRLGARG